MSRHFWGNYEVYRIVADPADWGQGVFNWAIPAVPEHKLALIPELGENYPLDGLELDFLRHWICFPVTGTTVERRREVTTDFIKKFARCSTERPGSALDALSIRVPHTTMTGKALSRSGTRPCLRTTEEQFDTSARLVCSQAAAGVGLFNLPYYREHTTPAIRPLH